MISVSSGRSSTYGGANQDASAIWSPKPTKPCGRDSAFVTTRVAELIQHCGEVPGT